MRMWRRRSKGRATHSTQRPNGKLKENIRRNFPNNNIIDQFYCVAWHIWRPSNRLYADTSLGLRIVMRAFTIRGNGWMESSLGKNGIKRGNRKENPRAQCPCEWVPAARVDGKKLRNWTVRRCRRHRCAAAAAAVRSKRDFYGIISYGLKWFMIRVKLVAAVTTALRTFQTSLSTSTFHHRRIRRPTKY